MEDHVETLIVGGGQAGLAMSEHLSNYGFSHLVIEQSRIAERWRSARWDSLVANGPAWHDRFPSMPFSEVGPDEFASRDAVVDYFESFAEHIRAPVRCGVEVTDVNRLSHSTGFRVTTTQGVVQADNVVAATGPFQHPQIPPIVPANTRDIFQIHSSDYRNPAQLPEGAVLVVGAGSSGSQIAEELLLAGSQVFLSVGPHDRPPRSYRGRDFVWWLGVLGKWDIEAQTPGTEHVTIAVSGAAGGHTIDFRQFAERGMILTGQTRSYKEGVLYFADDLAQNIANGDASYLSLLDEADAYVKRFGIDLPEEPSARNIEREPTSVSRPILSIDLAEANVTSIIWATGYSVDYSWLSLDVLDESGRPLHNKGITSEPGLYFLGLPWQSRRGSSFIWGVWHDAKYLADHIARQRAYMRYDEHGNG